MYLKQEFSSLDEFSIDQNFALKPSEFDEK